MTDKTEVCAEAESAIRTLLGFDFSPNEMQTVNASDLLAIYLAGRGAAAFERQDGSALMKIAADLANRHPLRQLYLVCEHQGRINTDSLHEHLDKCGDLLAGIALDIRREIASQPAPVSARITLQQVLKAYQYADSHPHKYLRGTTNWCAAVAHELNACLDKVKELNQ